MTVPAGSWRERWLSWRDRLLADAKFRRRAIAFPPTRRLANERARDLFDIMAGFVYTQVLLACVRLDLFGRLAPGPMSIEDLARSTKLGPDGMQRLADAAVALRLLQWRDAGRLGLGTLGATLVGNDALLAMVEHHATLYDDLADPVALLRGDAAPGLANVFPYAVADEPSRLGAADVGPYSALMSASQVLVGDEILRAYPFGRHRCVLDVGGGEGTFLLRLAQAQPGLKLRLFDLPAVAERARVGFAAAGLQKRAEAFGGDFRKDVLPRGADLVTLLRVAHDHEDATVAGLLRSIREALAPGGSLLLAEPMAGGAGVEPMGAAYFGMYLLAMGSGRPRTSARLADLMRDAGFDNVRLLPSRIPLQVGLLHATVHFN